MLSGIQVRDLFASRFDGFHFVTRRLSEIILGAILVFLVQISGYAAEKTKLTYTWEQGQHFAYRINIIATLDDYTETLSGVEQYEVIKSDSDSISLRCTGSLNSTKKSKSKRLLIHPMRLHRHRSPFTGLTHNMMRAFEPHVLNMNRYGEIDTIKGSSSLPYLIGNLSEINLIPLSPENNAEWSENEKTSISIISSDRIPLTLRGTNVEKTMGAKQTTDYKITGQTAEDVSIEVKHFYRTIAMIDGSPEVELVGTGTIQFDKKQDGVKSLTMNYKLFRRSETSVHKIPISISSKQMTKAELLKYRADQKELQKKHQAEIKKRKEASKFEVPENIDADLKNILQDLATTNVLKRKTALKKLSESKPTQENPEISKILIKVLKSGDIIVVADASKALVVWSTKEDVPALIELLSQVNILGADAIMDSILKHQTTEGVLAVAKLLKEPLKSHNASKKLIAYGSGAEEAVLDQLDTSNLLTLVRVFSVLKEIGTEKSLNKIDEISRSTKNQNFKFHAAAAVKAIKARERK